MVHALFLCVEKMKKCIVICALYEGEPIDIRKDDFVICADKGFEKAMAAGIRPDAVVGDFDSSRLTPADVPADTLLTVLPWEKDDTDLGAAIKVGREKGYAHFEVYGALGGRLDHTMAAIQLSADCAKRGESMRLISTDNTAEVFMPGSYTLPKEEGCYLSLFAYTPEVKGVTLRGTHWELENAALDYTFPVGCSNQWEADAAQLSFAEGMLLVMRCRKN